MTVRMSSQERREFPPPSQIPSGKVRHKAQTIHDFINQRNSKPQNPNVPLSVIPNNVRDLAPSTQTTKFPPTLKITTECASPSPPHQTHIRGLLSPRSPLTNRILKFLSYFASDLSNSCANSRSLNSPGARTTFSSNDFASSTFFSPISTMAR